MSLRYLLGIIAFVLLAPLLILQGLYLRRHAIRLPPARGERKGVQPGTQPALRVLILGESTAAGVGAESHQEALSGQFVKALSEHQMQEIRWEAAGLNGLTAARTAITLLPWVEMDIADVVVLALGVNDTLALRTPRRWLRELNSLVEELRQRFQPRLVVLSAVPPVGRFVAIPQPLRGVFGAVAQSLDEGTRRAFAGNPSVLYVPLPITLQREKEYLCRDGFHPSPAGYAVWGQLLASAIAQHDFLKPDSSNEKRPH